MLPLLLEEHAPQKLRGEPMKDEPPARLQRDHLRKGMLVVNHDEVLGGAEDPGDVDPDRLVELKGIRCPPEVVVREEELIDWRENLDRRLDIDEVAPAARHRVDLKIATRDHGEVERRPGLQS